MLKWLFHIVLVLLLLSACGSREAQRMHYLLQLIDTQNKSDSVFHSDSIQRLLVDYYDRHGTANEKMLAYYLLGRAHYDMSVQAISNVRRRLLQRVFHQSEGGSKEFDRLIMKL